MADRFVLAQISDTHIRIDDDGLSVRRLSHALAAAAAHHADAIVLTGDLANDERAGEYAALAQALARPTAPVYLLPGNHDDRGALREAFPGHAYLPSTGRLCYVVEEYPVRLIALDQIAPGETYGEMDEALAAWLADALAAAPDTPTIVALHHPPFFTHDLLFDRIGLRDAVKLAAAIAPHRQVMRVICGHHHRAVFGQIAHAPVVIAPSTSWAYGLALHEKQPLAPRTQEQPGWALHVWTRAGGLASHIMGL